MMPEGRQKTLKASRKRRNIHFIRGPEIKGQAERKGRFKVYS